DEILYRAQSYVAPSAYYRVGAGTAPRVTSLAATPAADFSDIEVKRVESTSRDGTRVPLTILLRKGTPLDGRNPTLLYGYGGYDISLVPYFDAMLRLWFDHGGVYVVANLRGRGEVGDALHPARPPPKQHN